MSQMKRSQQSSHNDADPDQILCEANEYLQNNQIDRAMRCFRRVTKLLPLHCQANLQLSCLSIHAGKIDDALVYVNTALRAEPRNLTAWALLILLNDDRGDSVAVTETTKAIHGFDLPLDQIEQICRSLSVPPEDRLNALQVLLPNGTS